MASCGTPPGRAALLVLELAVRVVGVAHQTILLADLVMPCLPVHLPFFRALFDLLSLPGESLVVPVEPSRTLLAAAAAAADGDADQDGSAQHGQGDDEGFKVQPTQTPPGLGQRAHGRWGQKPSHWVF